MWNSESANQKTPTNNGPSNTHPLNIYPFHSTQCQLGKIYKIDATEVVVVWKQNPSPFLHPNFASPTNSTLPDDFFPGRRPYPRQNLTTHTEISHQAANLSNSDRDILSIENRQFIETQSIKHETKLANEIWQLYCKITAVHRSQTVLLAQSN